MFRTYLESWLQSASFHAIHHCNSQMSLVTQPLDNDILLFLKAEEVLYDHELILSSLFIPSTPCMSSITFLLFLIHSRGTVKLLLILLNSSLPLFVSSHSHFPLHFPILSSFPILFTTDPSHARTSVQPYIHIFVNFVNYFYGSYRWTKIFPLSVPAPRPRTPSLRGSKEERGWGNQLSDNYTWGSNIRGIWGRWGG